MAPQTSKEYYLPKQGSYKDFQTRDVPVPKPKANEVLVRVHAVSLQYRDLAISKGSYDIGRRENIVPCSDMAGEVVSVGIDVKDWKAGDRVCSNFSTELVAGPPTPETVAASLGGQADGVLTQYKVFPAYSLVKIPSHLNYVQASTLPCAAVTAYNALLGGSNPLKAGDYVVVLGTGGVSIFALQFAVASGAIVIATSSSDEKLKVAAKLGARHLINYQKTPNWEDEVEKITGGRGADHVVEVGGAGTLLKSLASVRLGGNVPLVGFIAASDTKDDSTVFTIITKAIDLRGVCVGSVAQFKDMNRLIEAHPDKTVPLVDKVFAYDDVISAYAHLESQKHVGKVVIEVAKV
ncbi:zinc-binding alcohol dehydrogenase [Coprinellus micaceus]|uniref:Zinc-binding alcohol dehydrogenase n=1 Tax=Coprinellus micaceus TaxID=71717 RepID=A0A4Y7TIZ1_COPMI|nr:zinc-binding alcohol dehydrogenase [Coprinellus micaceus]